MRGFIAHSGLWIVFVVSVLILWRGAAPGLTYHDSGEFALAAAVGGIPHAPGAPTYCLLAWGFVGVVQQIAPGQEPAYLTNLFSGLCGALTITLTAALARLWNRHLFGEAKGDALPLLLVPAILLGCAAFVEQSCVTEQYTLLTALLMGALLVLTRFYLTRKRGFVLALGLLIGLAIGNHLSQMILVPLLAIAALCVPRGRRLSVMLLGCLGLFIGLLVYLYLPLRTWQTPAIDFCHVETWEQFLWSLGREQWQSRPLSAAPPGFAQEWLLSYDFVGQLGVCGAVLAALGAAVLWRQDRRLLALLLGIGGAYGGGLLLAHLRQAGMDLAYLRGYGVADWHIPLYTLAALLACVGAEGCAHSLPKHGRFFLSALGAGLLLWGGRQALTCHSLRHFNTPQIFIEDVLKPLPVSALILPSGDNLLLTMGYAASGISKRPWSSGQRVLWGRGLPSLEAIDAAIAQDGVWRSKTQAAYLIHIAMEDPPYRYRTPPLSDKQAGQIPVFIEFAAGHPLAAQNLRPAGWLFEVRHAPVSDDDVRRAEQQLHEHFPQLFRPPTGRENRLEREARGLMHQNRAAYFYERKLWPEAVAAFTLACGYLSRSSSSWLCLGTACESTGETLRAQEAYLKAIEAEPDLEGPRLALGTLLAQAGHLEAARMFLADELTRNPKNDAARTNLTLVTRQLQTR
ncbi:protein O-mannosyl-transferase family [Armatimonas sp.]|uniref:protein O-mannosyl-transferase family n=1 Tax=Armatimonas sp. TaxID=1872638 RepID=UPI00374D68C0